MRPEPRAIKQADRPRSHHQGEVPRLQHRRRPGIPGPPKRLAAERTIRQQPDPAGQCHGLKSPPIAVTPQWDSHFSPNPLRERRHHCGRIDQRNQCCPRKPLPHHLGQDRVPISRGTRTGGVGGIHQHNGPRRLVSRDPHTFLQSGQRDLHPLVMRPKTLGQFERPGPGAGGVSIQHHEATGSQFGDIGERIAPHHGGRQAPRAGFNLLRPDDALADGPGLGDQFIAPHQGRDLDPSRHRPDPIAKNSQQ